MNKLDVAIYLRKSRADVEEEQKAMEKGESYDTLGKHRRELFALARKGQHNVLDIFEEVVSGESISGRPKMQELLKNVAQHKYEGVLVVDVDRLGRGNKSDQGKIENTFRDSGTLIITPSSIYDLTQEEGEFSVEVKTFLANMEYRSIKRRLQRGLVSSAKQGKDVGGKSPYGYKKDEELRLVIDEEKANVVRLIFELRLSGSSVREIANTLYNRGIESPSGNERWGTSMVKKVLSNQKYIGSMTYGLLQHTKRDDGRYKVKQKVDESKIIIVEAAHEPIISREDFEAVRKMNRQRHAKVNDAKTLVYPFATILKCGSCGRAIKCQTPNDRPRQYLYCPSTKCRTKGTLLETIEIVVISEIRSILDRLKKGNTKVSGSDLEGERGRITRVIEDVKAEWDKNNEKKEKVYDLFESGDYTKEMFHDRLKQIQDAQRENEREIEDLNARLESLGRADESKAELIPRIEQVLDVYFDHEKAEDRNRLLKTIIKEITLSHKTKEPKIKVILLE